MMNKKVTGVGCFAKPATLSRVFKKMVQNYTLGKFESINPVKGYQKLNGVESTLLLNALIAGKTGHFPSPDLDSGGVGQGRKITGFFLTLRDQQLNLSIFARGAHNNRERYTASFDGFTELRQKRLN